MNALPNWLTPDALRTLGLALLHFVWQGAALAVLGAIGFAWARRASTRYVLAVGTLSLMVAAPVVTFVVLQQTGPAFTPNFRVPVPVLTAADNLQKTAANVRTASAPAASPLLSSDRLTIFVEFWFIGVVLFSLRTMGGFLVISRIRRRDSRAVDTRWLALCHEMQDRLGITRAVHYCQSFQLDAPAVVGWFRPVVLLPVSALTGLNEVQLRAVIAHELAHIRRLDAFFNLFQVAAETLLFYHPAVWWLSKRIRVERENCCDDVALAVCGNPAQYARALALMEEWRAAPAFAMAANRGPLALRIARLLGLAEKGSSVRTAGVALAVLCLASAGFAGNALFGLVHAAAARSSAARQASGSAPTPDPVIVVTAPRPAAQAKPTPNPDPSAQQSNAQHPAAAPKQSFIDGMKAEGFDNLTADELISLKVQGVTPEYIHEIRAEGLHPTVDELVAMKVQGITPVYIRQVVALNLKVNIDGLIGMKVQGITPEYVDQMRKLGFAPDTDQLIGIKVQGITPEYVDQMRKLGFNPNTDQLIGMKVQGITPEYVDQMRKLGFTPDADEIIGMKVQGITPDYVKQLNDLGIKPDADDLIGMKVQGIDANYIRAIRSTGLSPDKDEWVSLKVQGINADYIKNLQAAGFKPSVDEVVSAKIQGITPKFIEQARSHGFKDLTLEKLIQLKNADVLE